MNKNIISISPQVLGGTPVFSGTRVPIQNLFDYIEGGYTIEQFLNGFPSVAREQVIEIIKIAENILTSEKFILSN